MIAYSKLYGGDFLKRTSGPNRAFDAEQFFFILQQRW
jgi:hypothetical protein